MSAAGIAAMAATTAANAVAAAAATAARRLTAGEHHRFEAAGQPFVYLVPSAAIFALDETADAIMRALTERPYTRDELIDSLAGTHDRAQLDATLIELARVRAIDDVAAPAKKHPKILPLTPFPLTTMVLNVTNQCNLACTYCYEYGLSLIHI